MAQPRDSRGRFARTWGPFVVAGTIGLSAAVGVGAEGAGASAGSTPAADAAVSEQASVSVRSARTTRQKSTRTRARLALRNPSAKVTAQAETSDCAELASGAVKQYLATHRCESLQRAAFDVSYGRDGAVVAVAWIEMASEQDAQELKEVLDSPGTGSIRPLDRRITLTGQHYDSDINGTLVTTAEAEPVAASVAARVLKATAAQAAG